MSRPPLAGDDKPLNPKERVMNARILLSYLGALLLVGGVLAGCDDDNPTNTGGQGSGTQTVYDTASGLADYSILVQAVDKAGLTGALQDAGATLTVFAPDNDAFAALLTAIGASSLDDLSADQLRPILLYHVLGSQVDAAAATAAATSGDKVAGLGGSIQLAMSGSNIQLDGSALVEAPDVMASNGIIHGISAVILPSITDVVVSDSEFSSLATALTVADTDPSNPGLVAALDDDDGTFTVFAPTNDAFAGLVSALSASASTGISGLGDFQPYQLIPVLKYHVVAGAAVASTGVTAGPIGTLGGNVTAATGAGVTVDGANVIVADILTSNGIIHVVDGVLVPSITDVVTTAPEFDSLKSAVIAADADGGTSPKVAAALDAPAASGSYTLFAPDNMAFVNLGAAPGGQALTNVLLYHVINQPTAVYAADALGLSGPLTVDTLLGSTANTQLIVDNTGSPANAVVVDDAGSAAQANVNAANYFTSNGVIHKVSKVLLPN